MIRPQTPKGDKDSNYDSTGSPKNDDVIVRSFESYNPTPKHGLSSNRSNYETIEINLNGLPN